MFEVVHILVRRNLIYDVLKAGHGGLSIGL